MSASPSRLPTAQPPFEREMAWQDRFRLIVATTVIAYIALLNAIGLLIVLRRLAGALSDSLPRDAMLLTALVSTATLACARTAWRGSFPLEQSDLFHKRAAGFPWDAIVGWGSSLALALLAVGCCYPANQTSDWLIWLPPLVADQFWRQTFFDAGQPRSAVSSATDEQHEELNPATLAFPTACVSDSASFQEFQGQTRGECVSDDAGKIVQQLFRVRDDEGLEVVYGRVRADFRAGQRTAVVHVGFCPPLSHLPEIEAESLPGSPTRIKVVQALAHGTRIDVRLPTPAENDRHVWIDMAATPVPPREEIRA